MTAAIDTISEDLLVPAEVKGTRTAGNFADARLVAQDLARRLDTAYRMNRDSIPLRLSPDYDGVKDRAAMIGKVVQMVHLIREALPHRAAGVRAVDLYFGDRLVRRVLLASPAE